MSRMSSVFPRGDFYDVVCRMRYLFLNPPITHVKTTALSDLDLNGVGTVYQLCITLYIQDK